jgi:uncharacterized protein
MYTSKQDLVAYEKYLKLNERDEYVIDCAEPLRVLDFHTHMSNMVPVKGKTPDRRGIALRFPILEPVEKLNLHIPYWKEITQNDVKGIGALFRHTVESIQILNDMANGGTLENAFRSQDENCIEKSVLLPLSARNKDLSDESLATARQYPTRFIPFCSVHPLEKDMRARIFQHKQNGARG